MASDATLNLILDLKGADKAQSALSSLGNAAVGLGKVALFSGAAVAVGGFVALGAAITAGVNDARGAAIVFAQTEAVITSTGGAAGVTADQVADYAASLSDAAGQSLFGDDQIQQSANLLLSFTNIKGGALEAATAMSVDMAQAMGGAPKDAAIQLGKALNDPIAGISALSRVGVTFTEEQKNVIAAMVEGGDVAGAQGVILAELNKEFGGSAAAAAEAAGGMVTFKANLGEIAESVGASLLPALDQMGAALASPAVIGGIQALADGLTGILGSAITWLTDTAIPSITTGWASISTAFETGGLAGVAEVVAEQLSGLASSIIGWIGEQAAVWGPQLATWAVAFGQWIIDAIPNVLANLTSLREQLLSGITDALPNVLAAFASFAGPAAQWLLDAVPGLLANVATFIQSAITQVATYVPQWVAALAEFGIKAVSWIADKIPDLVTNLTTFGSTMINWVVDQLPEWGAKLGDLAGKLAGWVLEALPGLATNLGEAAGTLLGWIGQTIGEVVPKLAEMGGKFIAWVQTDVLPNLPAQLNAIADALWSFITTTAANAGPKLTELAGAFVDWLDTVLPGIEEKIDAITAVFQNWYTEIGGGPGMFDAVTDAINGLISAVQGIIGFVQEHVAVQALLIAGLTAVATGYVLATAASIAHKIATTAGAAVTWLMTTAQTALNVVMTANPIGLVVIALAALAAGLVYAYKNSETFRAVVDGVWASIKTFFANIPVQLGIMRDAWFRDWNTIKTTVTTIWTAITTAVTTAWTNIKTAVATAVSSLTTFLSTSWTNITTFVTTAWTTITKNITTAWTNIKTGIATAITTIVTTITTFLTTTATTITTKIATWVTAIVGFAAKVVSGLPAPLATIVTSIGTWIITTAATLLTKAKAIGSGILDGIKAGIEGAWAGVSAWITTQVNKIPAAIRTALGISSPSKVMADTVGKPMAEGIGVGFEGGIKGIKAQVGTATLELVEKVASVVQAGVAAMNALAGVKAPVAGSVKAFVDALAAMVTLIMEASRNFKTKGLVAAEAFSTSATEIVGVVTAGVTALKALATWDAETLKAETVKALVDGIGLVVTEVQTMSRNFKTKGLEAARAFSAAAIEILGVLKAGADTFLAVADFKAVPATQISDLMTAIQTAVGYVVTLASKVKVDGLAAASDFSEHAGKVFDMLKIAAESFKLIADFKDIPTAQLASFQTAMVAALGFVVTVASKVKEDGLEAASAFSEHAGKVFTALKTAAEAFKLIVDFKDIPSDQLSNFQSAIVTALGFVVTVAGKVKEDGITAAGDFSEHAGKVFGMLKTAAEAFKLIVDFKDIPSVQMESFQAAIVTAVGFVVTVASKVKEDGLTAASDFSEHAGKVFSTLKTAAEAFKLIVDFKDIPSAQMTSFGTAIGTAIQAVTSIALKVETEAIEAANDFAEQAGAVFTTLKTAAEAFKAIVEFKDIPAAQMESFGAAIDTAIRLVIQIAKGLDTDGVTAANEFALKAGAVFTTLKTAAEAFKAIVEFKDIPYEQMQSFGAAIDMAVRLMEQIAKGLTDEGITTAREFAEAAAEVFKAVSEAAKGLAEIAQYKEMAPDALNAFANDFNRVLGMLEGLKDTGNASLDQARLFMDAVQETVKIAKDAVAEIQKLDGLSATATVTTTTIFRNIIEYVNETVGEPPPTDPGTPTGEGGLTAAVMSQIAALQSVLGITSPSTYMAEHIGRPMMQGIAVGFNSELHSASSSMGGDVRGVVQGIADGLSAIGGGGGLSGFVGAVKTIIDQIVAVAAQFSAEAIKAAEDFVDLANKVMTLLKNGVEAFEKVSEFQGVPTANLHMLGAAIKEAVGMIAGVAGQVSVEGAAAAGAFATATNSVFTLLKNAVEGLKGIADFKAVPTDMLHLLGGTIQQAVGMLAGVAGQMSTEAATVAGQFATATNSVFTLLKNAVEGLKGIADFQAVPTDQMSLLGGTIQSAVTMIGYIASQISTEGAAAAGLFASATNSVFTLLKNAVESLKGIADFQAVPTTQMALLGGTIQSAVAMLANIAGLISTTGATAAGVFSTAVGSVFTLLKNATEGLKGIADFQAIPSTQLSLFAGTIESAVMLLANIASHISTAGAAAAGAFSAAVGGVFTLLKNATEGLKGINDFQEIPGRQMQAFSDAIALAVLLIEYVASHISEAGAAAAGKFSAAVGGVFTLLKTATEGLKGINDFQYIPGAQMQSFSDAIDSAITMIAAVAARVGIDGATAAGDFSKATGGIFGTLKAAAEAFATISTFEGIPAAKMTSFGKAIDDTIGLMVAIAARVGLDGAAAARDFAAAVGPVFTTLKTAAESFTAIATFKDIPKQQLYHFQLAWNKALLLIRALVNAAEKYGIAATNDFVAQSKLMYDGLKNAADAIAAIAGQKEVAPDGIATFRTSFDLVVRALGALGNDAARGVIAAQRFKRLGEAIRDQILAGVGAIMELDGISITANVTAAVAVKQAGQQASALSLTGLSGAVTGATPIPTANVSNSVSIGNLTIMQQPGEDAEDLADRIIARLHSRQRLAMAAY